MKKLLIVLTIALLILPFTASATTFKINQIITTPFYGWIFGDGVGTSTLVASTSPTVTTINATSTTATSTFPNLAITTTFNFLGTIGTVLSDFCTAITGGAGLCDGTDATGSGTGNVGTSTPDVDTQVAYFTSNSATPALIGGEAAFTYDDATNILTTGSLTASDSVATSTFVGNVVFGSEGASNGGFAYIKSLFHTSFNAGSSPLHTISLGVSATGEGMGIYGPTNVLFSSLTRQFIDSVVVISLDGVTGRPIHIGGVVNEDVILARGGGNVGINDSTPSFNLDVDGTGRFTGTLRLGTIISDGNDITITPTNNTIFSDGTKVLIGHTSDLQISNNSPFQILGTTGAKASMSMGRFTSSASAVASYNVLKSRSGTIGSFVILQDNDKVGQFKFLADDGSDYDTQIAVFSAEVDDANPATGVIGGALVFAIGNGTDAIPVERMRIGSDGNLGIGTTSPYAKLSVAGRGVFDQDIRFDFFTATSTTATSTIAGGLAIETSGFVYDFSSNKVGIGTSSPTTALTIDDSATPHIFFGDEVCSGNVGFTGLQISTTTPTTCDDFNVLSNGLDLFLNIRTGGDIFFREQNVTQMVITGGLVGIGTTTPYAKLSVVGEVVMETFNATSTTASSTIAHGLNVLAINQTGSATSTFAQGIDLSAGCFAINGTCVGGGGGAETNSLETTITGILDTEFFVGNGADSGTFVTAGGDLTLANTGAFTIIDDIIVKANFADEDWGDLSVLANSITLDAGVVDSTAITDNTIQTVDLEATNTEADNDIVTVDTGTGGFTFNTFGELGIQAQDDVLDDLSALSVIGDNEFIVGTGAGTYANESGAAVVTSLENGVINIILSTEIDTSSELAGIVGDETGTGVLVFGTAPTFITSLTVTGGCTIDADGIDCVTGNDFEINGTAVLDATTLGGAVINSSLQNVGTLTALTISGATIISGGSLEIPNADAPTVNAIGEIALDTTSMNLILATSTNATEIVFGGGTTTLYAFTIASTSADFVSGGAVEFPSHFLAQVAVAVICEADSGTSVVINLSDTGTNDTNTITCTTTSTQFQFTSNNTFTAYENIRLEIGTITGTVDRLSVHIIGYRSTD